MLSFPEHEGCGGSEISKHKISHKSRLNRKCSFHFHLLSSMWFWLPHKKLCQFQCCQKVSLLVYIFYEYSFHTGSQHDPDLFWIKLKNATSEFFERISDKVEIDLNLLQFVFVIDGKQQKGRINKGSKALKTTEEIFWSFKRASNEMLDVNK